MLLSTLTITPVFRQFLYTLTTSIKLHQSIAFYYDLSHVSKVEKDILYAYLSKFYEKFYNVTFFSDYVPGFLTNSDGVSLLSKKANFSFIVFLNYNPKNAHQNSLLNEFITLKYEYILISPNQIDLVAFVPFLYLSLDLNDIVMLKIVNFYILNYILLFINSRKHNLYGNIVLQTKYNFNCFFLITLIRHKKLLNYYLKKFVKYKQDINTILKLVKILLSPTKYKKQFLSKYYTPFSIEFLNLINKKLRNVFHIEIKNLFLKLHEVKLKKKRVNVSKIKNIKEKIIVKSFVTKKTKKL